jgi:hypothetical protein
VSANDQLAALRAAARYHRERHELYLAKTLGPRLTRPARLSELQRAREMAESRLARAEAAHLDREP